MPDKLGRAVAVAAAGLHRPGVGGGAAGRARAWARGLCPALAAAALVAMGCAGPRRREPPEPELRLWTPGIVYWSRDRRTFPLAVENGTSHAIQVEAPRSRRARVVLFLGPGPDQVCAHDADAAGPPADPVSLAPGEGRGVRVDLEAACGRLPAGEYRYEAAYEAPAIGAGPPLRLRTAHGHVVIEPGGPPALGGGGRDGAADPSSRSASRR